MWDVDAWLDEAQPPTRAVRIYGRADLVAQLQALAAGADSHERRAQAGLAAVDVRLAGNGPAADNDLLRSDAVHLVDELEASARTFILRGLLDSEVLDITKAATTTVVVDGKTVEQVDEAQHELLLLSAAAVDPKVTPEQAGRLRDAVGQAQWNQLFDGITAASREGIDVPLSQLGLETGRAS